MPRPWIVVWAVLVLAGCGGDDARLEAGAAGDLHRTVDVVRSAAKAKDREAALRALDRLDRRVREQAAGGGLSEAAAADLRKGIANAKRRARREIAEPEPAPVATQEPAAPAATPVTTPAGTPEPSGKGKKPKKPKPQGGGPQKDGGGDQGDFDDEGGD